jgi:hypothetical protein
VAFVSSIFKYFLKSPKKHKIRVCLNRIESMSLLWLKRHKTEVIVYVENGKSYNKQQHVHNLLLAMTHYNCLETKTRQPRHDGIVEKWTQSVDSATRKCGLNNDWQSRTTTTHSFFVLRKWQSFVAKSSCNTVRAGSSFNQQREKCRQISKSDSHVQFNVGIHFTWCQS